MLISEIFGGVATVIAELNPGEIIQLKAPESMSDRVADLIEKKKSGEISAEESVKPERFLALDLFIGLTKAKAHLLLKK